MLFISFISKKFKIYSLFLACSFFLCSSAYAADVISLEILEAAVLQRHPSIKAAQMRAEAALAREDEAIAGFFPKIDAQASGVRVREANAAHALDTATGLPIGIVPLGYRDTYRAALVLSQILYSGGTLSANRLAAAYGFKAASAELMRTQEAVLNGVRTAFYSYQRARASLDVAQLARELALAHLKQVELFFNAGIVAKSDVLRVQVDASFAELNVIRSLSQVAISFAALERAIGAPFPMQDYTFPEPDLDYASLYDVPSDPVAQAVQWREDLKAMGFLRQQAQSVVRATQGSYLPKLYLQGEVSALGEKFWPSDKDDYRMALSLEWRLFDAGERAAKINQAKASAEEILYNLDDMNNQIRQEAVQAKARLLSGMGRIEVAKRQVAQATEDYRLSLRRYESQVGTNLDVLDARLSLNNSRTELVNAIYDTQEAIANLKFAMGEPIALPVK